jgi:hypothetical protein
MGLVFSSDELTRFFEATEPEPPKAARRIPGADDFATPNRPEGWHTIYEDAEVRIQCRGTINEQQSDEVRVAAKLIRRILEQQN